MDTESDTPVGVKMLADHLVKVKLQYEERLNEMIVHVRRVELEKEEMRKQSKQMEEELELRRREVYQMKRESSSQYVIEERENWKAMLSQQQQVMLKLEKDNQVYKERISTLQMQLQEEIEDQNNEYIIGVNHESESTVVSLGPPQPLLPITPEEVEHTPSLSQDQEVAELKEELNDVRHLNRILTDQFIHRVDELEQDHRERENSLLETIGGLREKLDLELEKKWELIQQIRDQEEGHRGLISFLWG